MTPPPCSTMTGRTCLQVRNMDLRLTSMTRSQLGLGQASAGPPSSRMPTLLCRTSTRPKRARQVFDQGSDLVVLRDVGDPGARRSPPSPA